MDRICFERPTFNMYLFILVCIISYLVYFKFSEHYQQQKFDPYVNMSKDKLYNNVLELKDSLHDVKLKEQKCQIELSALRSNVKQSINVPPPNTLQDKFLSKIYNPLTPPENVYPGGNFNSRGYDGYQDYQMLGYLSGLQGRYPVFGRYKYPGKTDKLEYYAIDDSRGRIKIPFKTQNYNELYDGDSINIDDLGGSYKFKKYEDEGLRYNPNV
jgi:hypothetical protein